ncbi:hypothetical protein G6O67_003029 [Ophiocordyceps sinensis]|uniref:Uncharacterized protein n=2 Tax=Ophiocordyceps sinensis TaxID=72228 RepID=A0A8H4PVD7_9HYPO|nr:hypothetical protein OCS_02614 [Ophiocordyceps sinensis CO18]KAF4511211.1 hypothetical protein G6O67_003029 [Ophiocordyceps sinensis]
MASSDTTLSLAKTLVVPAVISLVIFLILTFVLVPIWRRYRNRYAQYLPLDSISERTSSLRHRIMGRFAGFGPFATFIGDRNVFAPNSALDDEADDGEELDEVDEDVWRAIERHVPAVQSDNTQRLSRDLEEGFMDDSDEEPVQGRL